jgi:hypothetical protein
LTSQSPSSPPPCLDFFPFVYKRCRQVSLDA